MVGEVVRSRARKLMCLGALTLGLSATALLPSPSSLAPSPSLEVRGSSWRPSKANNNRGGFSLRDLLLPEPLATASNAVTPQFTLCEREHPRA
ncbi:hypothetical protein [Calidithermus timidus]|jgi:hypothetical protein|uniref:hypothetical protein n=1 Tax=Calidithermus timidus TaxID=307124 RepID=UPI000366E759|nr:hypothetical protein [Calidithermus timidus]